MSQVETPTPAPRTQHPLVGRPTVLQEDCDGQLVPSATPITLLAGSQVVITQALGDSLTVGYEGHLIRIPPQSVDALGLPEGLLEQMKGPEVDPDAPLDQQLWSALKACYDPEIPVNVVDLGLIYQVHVSPLNDTGGHRAHVVMTLTAPGCGMGPVLTEDVRQKAMALPGVDDVHVELVFDPPWGREMMSEEAQLELGLL